MDKKKDGAVIIMKNAVVDVKQSVETVAINMNNSELIAPLDACTCTGNCC